MFKYQHPNRVSKFLCSDLCQRPPCHCLIYQHLMMYRHIPTSRIRDDINININISNTHSEQHQPIFYQQKYMGVIYRFYWLISGNIRFFSENIWNKKIIKHRWPRIYRPISRISVRHCFRGTPQYHWYSQNLKPCPLLNDHLEQEKFMFTYRCSIQ